MACFEESEKHCYWYLLIIITFRPLSYNQDSDCNQTFCCSCKIQQSIFLMWTSKEKWRKLNPSLMQISAECHIIMVVIHPMLWDWGKGAKCNCSFIFRIFWIPADVLRSCLLTKTRVFPSASKILYEKMYQRPEGDFTTRARFSAHAWASSILAGKCDSQRHSTTGFSENVVVAKTCYQMLEV